MTGARRAGALDRLEVWFEGPGRVGVRRGSCSPPGPGEVRVVTELGAISAGTELAALAGRLDPDLPRDDTLTALRRGGFRFPFQYGYASVGRVEAWGPGVGGAAPRPGRRVFAFVPHQTAFRIPAGEALPAPDEIPPDRAALFPYLETAVNLLLDGPPRAGERVAVVGQGALGLALTALLGGYPLGGLLTVEPRAARRALSLGFGAPMAMSPDAGPAALRDALGGRAELVFEVSGAEAGLDLAIRLAARDGRVIVGSWLAGGRTSLDLGGWFHRGRVRLISSQVSRLPALGPAWTIARRRALAWSLLRRAPLERLVGLRVPFAEASRAYAALGEGDAVAALLVSAAPLSSADAGAARPASQR